LEKETKKQGKTTETYRYRYDDNGNETFRIWEKTAPTPDYPGNIKLSGYYQKEIPTVYEWRYYDGFNQLSRINQDDKEITYQYRGDGLCHNAQVRKLTESQGKTNLYYWDGSNIVAEQADGSKIKTYLRGINLIAREIDGMVYYYILNEHGDVTQLWSQSGACKASYEYDAFGVERSPDKEDENPFRYCGEYIDLETNTYYLRARYYRSVTGRFTSEDTLRCVENQLPNEQEVSDPLSLNLYTYCHSNPVFYSDPTGHFVLPFLAVAGLAGLAAGILAGGISSAIQGKFSWGAVAQGAAVGSLVGLTGGAALAYGVTGSVLASTGAVASGLGLGEATVAGTAGAAGIGEVTKWAVNPQNQIVVTEELIRDTMKDVPLQTQQSSVSLPVIQNYVDRILLGENNIPPIKVDGNIIVDGNHRYIASRIAGVEIGIQQWTGARIDKVVEWIKIFIDSVDWGNR
jgi:RHS repeat-associated protein